tara:strand:+ start:377 stop:706 length:330 start_codon:yes stop_codon:yes gene_type:complete
MSKIKLKKGEKVEIIQEEFLTPAEAAQIPLKQEPKAPIKKEITFKQQLIRSDLAKRISPTTLGALADNLDKEDALKESLVLLNPFLRVCSLEDFRELSTAINSLNPVKP